MSVRRAGDCCFLFTASASPGWRSEAERGGPQGEILVGDSLAHGLTQLGYDVVRIASLRRFARHLLYRWPSRLRRTPVERTFFERWTFEAATRWGLISRRRIHRSLVFDWFGAAPPLGSGGGLDPDSYLAPYPGDGGKTFLGYILHHGTDPPLRDVTALRARLLSNLERKQRQGVIWGKEARYFEGVGHEIIARLSSICTLHTTLSAERGYRRGVFPDTVVNHGVLPPAAWRALLSQSSFLIGLGDPRFGPSALEALAEGCVYIDPQGGPGGSQHPYAAAIGTPFVHRVDLHDVAAVRHAVEASFDAGALRTALGAGASGQQLLTALEPFTERAYVARLRGILERRGASGR